MSELGIGEIIAPSTEIITEEALALLGGAVKNVDTNPQCIDGRTPVYSAEDLDSQRGVLTGDNWVL